MADLLEEFGVAPKKDSEDSGPDLLREFGAQPEVDLLSDFGVEAPKSEEGPGLLERGAALVNKIGEYTPGRIVADAIIEGKSPIRGEVAKTYPQRVIPGAERGIHQSSAALSDQEQAELANVRNLLERIGGEQAPSPKELAKIQSTKGKFYISEALNAKTPEDRQAIIARLDEERSAALASRAESTQAAEEISARPEMQLPEDATFLEKAGASVFESIAPTITGALASAINPALGVGIGVAGTGAMAMGSSYSEAEAFAREHGVELTPEKKMRVAVADTVLEMVGEKISLSVALKAGLPFFERIAKAIVAESTSETATQIMQDANRALQYDPTMTLDDFLYNAALAGTAGAMGGGMTGAVAGGAQAVSRKLGEERQLRKAVDDLLRSDSEELADPELEALRRMKPTGEGEPIDFGEESFKRALKTDAKRAAMIADRMLDSTEGPRPATLASDLWRSGEITIEQFKAFRNELLSQAAQRVGDLGAAEFQEAAAEESTLSAELKEFAEKSDYVPDATEVAEHDLAQEIFSEVSGLPSEQAANDHFRRRLLQAPSTPLVRTFRSIFLEGGNLHGTSQLYEGLDYRLNTKGGKGAAEYFLKAAQRQLAGQYAFAESLTPFRDLEMLERSRDVFWKTLDNRDIELGTTDDKTYFKTQDEELGKRMAGLLDTWRKQFAPRAKIGLIDRAGARALNNEPGGGTEGFWSPIDANEAVIFVEMDTSSGTGERMDEAKMVQVLAHEFGHFLGRHYLQQQPEHVQKALVKAWGRQARELQKANVKVDEAQLARRGPVLGGYPYSVPMQEGVEKSSFVRGYLMSMEEWMAHQMERMVTAGKLGLDRPVETFFKRYKAILQRFFERFKKDFSPTTTFETFVKMGAARERMRGIAANRFSTAEAALKRYGVEEIDLSEITDLKDKLNKTLINVKAQPRLQDSVLAASPEVQRRAVQAIERLGQYETAMFTPQTTGPEVPLSAEEWTSALEDAFLPGQTNNSLQLATAVPPHLIRSNNQGLPRSSFARQVGTFLRRIVGGRAVDQSPYQGHLDRYSWFRKQLYSLEQWAKINPHIEQLQRYVRQVRLWSADRMAWVSRADGRLRAWRKLSVSDQRVLGRFMLDQTLEGKFFDLNDPAVLQKYPMSQQVRDLYSQINADFQEFIAAVEGTLVAQAAKRLQLNPFAAAREIARIKERFDDLRKKPYFPLSRFGKYIVSVRATQPTRVKGRLYNDGEIIHFEAFDTELEQKAEFEKIKRAYPSGKAQMSMASEDTASLTGMPTILVEALKNNPDVALTDEQKRAVDEYLYKIAPGQSFVKHLIERRGVEGYTEDVMRAYANYFFHGASHLARIKHAEALNEEIKAIRLTAESIDEDATKRMAIANYMARHFQYVMQPENDWAAIRGAVAVAYLGFVPKTALVNLTQVPLVTYPHLAAKFGDLKAIRAIQKGYRDALAMYHVTKSLNKQEEEAITRWAQGDPPLPGDEKIIKAWSKFSNEEVAMLRRAVQETWIDESIAMELAAMSEGSWLTRYKATNTLGYYGRTAAHWAMMPFQAAEKLNRRVTAIAAFRLAKESGMNFEQAFEAARTAVSSSQYEYAKWNRAELLRGKKGVVFMFWQYMLNTLFFAFGGDKGWWRWWAVMLATVGPMGLPFAEDLQNLLTWILTKLGDDDERTNVKYEMRKLAKHLGEKIGVAPDLLLHGASRYGFGLMPFADMSGSLSIGRVIPGMELLGRAGGTWESLVTQGIEEGGGATAALVMRMLQALTADDMDALTRIEKGIPFTAGQKVIQAFKAYSRGAVETRGGADLVEFDPTDPVHMAEMIGMAAGFPARRVNEKREGFYLAQDYVRYYQIRRGILLKAFDDALESRDGADRKEALDAIRRYNKQVPSSALRITRDQLISSRRGRERSRSRIERGGHPQRMYNDLSRRVEEGKL